jgi:hypothetical protein
MSPYRFEIEASAGPARGSVLGRRCQPLVRVRLFDGPGVVDTLTGEPVSTEEVYTDLRPADARELAFELLNLAEHAERITEQSGW